MREARTLLRGHPALRALIASRLVSSAGTWLAYVALTVDVFLRTQSPAWVSAVLLADFLPSVLVATLAGPWLDRIPRRTLLVSAEVGAGLVFAALPFAPSAAAVVGLALCAGIAGAVFYPSVRAALPELVEEDELPRANSLSQTAATSGMAAGPLLAGLLVAAGGVDVAYALNALSFAVSALLLMRLPTLRRKTPADSEPRRYWQTAADGFRAYLSSPTLRTVLAVWVVATVGGAVVNVGEIFVARQAFHAGTFGFGLLASASGTGIVLGSMLAGRIVADSASRAAGLGLAVFAAGFGAAALAPSIWVAAACVFVGGLGNAVFLAAATLVVQQSTDDATRGQAFAIFDAAGLLGLAMGMAAGGVLIATFGPRGAWLAAAGVAAIAATGMLARLSVARPLQAEPSPS
jgi:MFS family permease